MQQKITWMRFSALGISFIGVLAATNCKKRVDYLAIGTYVYVNNTDSLIEVKNAPYLFTIKPKESHTIEQSGDGSKDLTEKNYVAPFTGGQVIIYGNKMCDTLFVSKEGISGIENYKSEKIAERHYKFTYNFTDTDYKKAVPCK